MIITNIASPLDRFRSNSDVDMDVGLDAGEISAQPQSQLDPDASSDLDDDLPLSITYNQLRSNANKRPKQTHSRRPRLTREDQRPHKRRHVHNDGHSTLPLEPTRQTQANPSLPPRPFLLPNLPSSLPSRSNVPSPLPLPVPKVLKGPSSSKDTRATSELITTESPIIDSNANSSAFVSSLKAADQRSSPVKSSTSLEASPLSPSTETPIGSIAIKSASGLGINSAASNSETSAATHDHPHPYPSRDKRNQQQTVYLGEGQSRDAEPNADVLRGQDGSRTTQMAVEEDLALIAQRKGGKGNVNISAYSLRELPGIGISPTANIINTPIREDELSSSQTPNGKAHSQCISGTRPLHHHIDSPDKAENGKLALVNVNVGSSSCHLNTRPAAGSRYSTPDSMNTRREVLSNVDGDNDIQVNDDNTDLHRHGQDYPRNHDRNSITTGTEMEDIRAPSTSGDLTLTRVVGYAEGQGASLSGSQLEQTRQPAPSPIPATQAPSTPVVGGIDHKRDGHDNDAETRATNDVLETNQIAASQESIRSVNTNDRTLANTVCEGQGNEQPVLSASILNSRNFDQGRSLSIPNERGRPGLFSHYGVCDPIFNLVSNQLHSDAGISTTKEHEAASRTRDDNFHVTQPDQFSYHQITMVNAERGDRRFDNQPRPPWAESPLLHKAPSQTPLEGSSRFRLVDQPASTTSSSGVLLEGRPETSSPSIASKREMSKSGVQGEVGDKEIDMDLDIEEAFCQGQTAPSGENSSNQLPEGDMVVDSGKKSGSNMSSFTPLTTTTSFSASSNVKQNSNPLAASTSSKGTIENRRESLPYKTASPVSLRSTLNNPPLSETFGERMTPHTQSRSLFERIHNGTVAHTHSRSFATSLPAPIPSNTSTSFPKSAIAQSSESKGAPSLLSRLGFSETAPFSKTLSTHPLSTEDIFGERNSSPPADVQTFLSPTPEAYSPPILLQRLSLPQDSTSLTWTNPVPRASSTISPRTYTREVSPLQKPNSSSSIFVQHTSPLKEGQSPPSSFPPLRHNEPDLGTRNMGRNPSRFSKRGTEEIERAQVTSPRLHTPLGADRPAHMRITPNRVSALETQPDTVVRTKTDEEERMDTKSDHTPLSQLIPTLSAPEGIHDDPRIALKDQVADRHDASVGIQQPPERGLSSHGHDGHVPLRITPAVVEENQEKSFSPAPEPPSPPADITAAAALLNGSVTTALSPPDMQIGFPPEHYQHLSDNTSRQSPGADHLNENVDLQVQLVVENGTGRSIVPAVISVPRASLTAQQGTTISLAADHEKASQSSSVNLAGFQPLLGPHQPALFQQTPQSARHFAGSQPPPVFYYTHASGQIGPQLSLSINPHPVHFVHAPTSNFPPALPGQSIVFTHGPFSSQPYQPASVVPIGTTYTFHTPNTTAQSGIATPSDETHPFSPSSFIRGDSDQQPGDPMHIDCPSTDAQNQVQVRTVQVQHGQGNQGVQKYHIQIEPDSLGAPSTTNRTPAEDRVLSHEIFGDEKEKSSRRASDRKHASSIENADNGSDIQTSRGSAKPRQSSSASQSERAGKETENKSHRHQKEGLRERQAIQKRHKDLAEDDMDTSGDEGLVPLATRVTKKGETKKVRRKVVDAAGASGSSMSENVRERAVENGHSLARSTSDSIQSRVGLGSHQNEGTPSSSHAQTLSKGPKSTKGFADSPSTLFDDDKCTTAVSTTRRASGPKLWVSIPSIQVKEEPPSSVDSSDEDEVDILGDRVHPGPAADPEGVRQHNPSTVARGAKPKSRIRRNSPSPSTGATSKDRTNKPSEQAKSNQPTNPVPKPHPTSQQKKEDSRPSVGRQAHDASTSNRPPASKKRNAERRSLNHILNVSPGVEAAETSSAPSLSLRDGFRSNPLNHTGSRSSPAVSLTQQQNWFNSLRAQLYVIELDYGRTPALACLGEPVDYHDHLCLAKPVEKIMRVLEEINLAKDSDGITTETLRKTDLAIGVRQFLHKVIAKKDGLAGVRVGDEVRMVAREIWYHWERKFKVSESP